MWPISIVNMKFPEMIRMNKLVHNIIDSNEGSQHYSFTFNSLKWIDPSGAIIFMETLENLREKEATVDFIDIENELRSAISYGIRMGIIQKRGLSNQSMSKEGKTFIAPTKIKRSEVYEFLNNENKNIEYYFEYISEKLSNKILREDDIVYDEHLKELFTYVIRELIRNIFDHSNSEYFYYGSQFIPKTRNVEFVIADRGLGLKKTIPFDVEEKWYGQDTTESAIRKAFTPGISAESNHSYASQDYLNSGYGLAIIKSLILAAEGTLSLATSDKAITFTEKNQNIEECNIKGTIIRIRVDLDNLSTVNFKNQLKLVEEEAKAMGIISKPSRSSQNL